VYQRFADGIGARGRHARDEWLQLFSAYTSEHPELADQLLRMQRRELPDRWDKDLAEFPPDEKGMGGRESSGRVLNALAQNVPWLLGGSADLSPSTKTRLVFETAGDFSATDRTGRNLHFGVREHAMHAIVNGLSLSKLRAFGSQFLIFSDYARTPIRLSAIMELPAIHIFTHDSIGVGEDGPTHQPIEQLAGFRATPGLVDMRPGDANEVVEAWRWIMQSQHDPVALILSRQNLPTLDRSKYGSAEGVARGAYVLADPSNGELDVILIATGSEIALAVEAYEQLTTEGVAARVVSMPSWELFERQSQEYRDSVLPPGVTARVAIEQASTFGWERYVGSTGAIVGMSTFGASAPLKELQTKFGFTPERIVDAAHEQIRSLSIA
jgi:transketolase